MPLYQLTKLTKRYGDGDALVTAIDGIDFAMDAGEFVAVVGPSGSGKSTLLQILGALDRPSQGSIEFEGRDLARLSDGELADLRLKTLGFVFQQFNLIPTLTAQENVEAAIAPTGASADERVRTARELLGRVGLGARADHLPSQLSGGEQQRVAIARALANRPDVLLADEPTGNIDSKTGETIVSLLLSLRRDEEISIVLVTHDAAIAERAPRVIRIADGAVVEDSGGQPAAAWEPLSTEVTS